MNDMKNHLLSCLFMILASVAHASPPVAYIASLEASPPRAYIQTTAKQSPLGSQGSSQKAQSDKATALAPAPDPYRINLDNIPAGGLFTVTAGLWHRPEANERLASGCHWHRCEACNLVVQHGDDQFNSRAAHTCPSCKRLIWDKASQPWITPAVVPTRPIQFSQPDCPT